MNGSNTDISTQRILVKEAITNGHFRLLEQLLSLKYPTRPTMSACPIQFFLDNQQLLSGHDWVSCIDTKTRMDERTKQSFSKYAHCQCVRTYNKQLRFSKMAAIYFWIRPTKKDQQKCRQENGNIQQFNWTTYLMLKSGIDFPPFSLQRLVKKYPRKRHFPSTFFIHKGSLQTPMLAWNGYTLSYLLHKLYS